jgi:hypothetical protein
MNKQKKGIGLWILDLIQVLCAGALIASPFGFIIVLQGATGAPDWALKVFYKRFEIMVVGSAVGFVSIQLLKRKFSKLTTSASHPPS